MKPEEHKYSLAVDYHDSRQWNKAIELLLDLLSENPDDPLYHAMLASCLVSQYRVSAAERENKIAISIDASMPFLHLTQARIYLVQRRIAKAIDSCNEAIRLDPELANSYVQKASLYSAMREDEKADENYQRALEIDSSNASLISTVASMKFFTGHREEAIELATEALRLDPSDTGANVLMGRIQLTLGNTSKAEHHARVVIMQYPDNYKALAVFAGVRLSKGWWSRLWWRVGNWMETRGIMGAAIVVLGGYLGFNLSAQIALDLGYSSAATALRYAWFAVLFYSLISVPWHRHAIAKELQKFSLKTDY